MKKVGFLSAVLFVAFATAVPAVADYLTRIAALTPVDYWKLDDTGGTAVDVGRNGYALTYGASVTSVVDGMPGFGAGSRAALFAGGATSRIADPLPPDPLYGYRQPTTQSEPTGLYPPGGSMSVLMWVKPALVAGGADQPLYTSGNEPGAYRGYLTSISICNSRNTPNQGGSNGADPILPGSLQTTFGYPTYAERNAQLVQGQWNMIVMNRPGWHSYLTSTACEEYINGVFGTNAWRYGTSTRIYTPGPDWGTSGVPVWPNGPITICAGFTAPSDFVGEIAQVAVFNHWLSAANVTDLYAEALVPEPATLVLLGLGGFGLLLRRRR
jgi:hypothetical protein